MGVVHGRLPHRRAESQGSEQGSNGQLMSVRCSVVEVESSLMAA